MPHPSPARPPRRTNPSGCPSTRTSGCPPGEAYQPILPADTAPPEATRRSIVWGLLLCIVFTVASAYSGLKVGQVMEAAIPISILAIGLARVYRRRSTLLENVILTGIGGTSGAVVAGAIFTLPALYTLGLDPHPAADDLHLPRRRLPRRALPDPAAPLLRARDARRVPVSRRRPPSPRCWSPASSGGSQAKLLLQATAIAGVYDFFVTTFQVWREFVDLQFVPAVKTLADQARMVARASTRSPSSSGLGYVMGLRSSMVLVAGGVLSNLVLVPLIWMIGQHLPDAVYPAPCRSRR